MFHRLISAIRMFLYIRTGNERFLNQAQLNEKYILDYQRIKEEEDRAERESYDRSIEEEIQEAYRDDEEHDRSHREGRYWDPEHCDMCRELLEEEDREELGRYLADQRSREYGDDETPPGVLTWSQLVPDYMIDDLVELGYTPETYAQDIEDMWDEVDRIEREADEEIA